MKWFNNLNSQDQALVIITAITIVPMALTYCICTIIVTMSHAFNL